MLVRFGRWQDIIDAPMPDEPGPLSRHHGHASLRQGRGSCRAEKLPRRPTRERDALPRNVRRIPNERRFFNNPAHDSLAVGEKMLDGELEYHQGNHEAGYAHLRESVRRDDNLQYIEPWAWMHPPRHALAALLSEQGHYEEAEQIYRDDLGLSGKHPAVRPAP